MTVSSTVITDKVGKWIKSLSWLSLFPSLSSLLQLLITLFFSTPTLWLFSLLNSTTSVVCNQFSAVWIDVFKFQTALANVLQVLWLATYKRRSSVVMGNVQLSLSAPWGTQLVPLQRCWQFSVYFNQIWFNFYPVYKWNLLLHYLISALLTSFSKWKWKRLSQ